MQYAIPLLISGALFITAPGSTPENTAPKHPHYNQAVKIGGAKGNILLTYFTVPFNPEKVGNSTKPGFTWHLGFSQFKTEVPLKAGDANIPVGSYLLNARVNKDGKSWTFVLKNAELAMARRNVRRQRRNGEDAVAKAREKVTAIEAKIKKGEILEEIVVPTTAFKADNEEHMAMYAISRGYKTRRRGGVEVFDTTGVKATIRVSFGDLHYQFQFTEFCKGVKPPEPRQGRRGRGGQRRR